MFAAYEIINNEPHQIPIKIESDSKFSVKDLTGKSASVSQPKPGDILEEVRTMGAIIDRWRSEKSPEYKKLPPQQSGSDFSTLA